jgi:hypothetical protein
MMLAELAFQNAPAKLRQALRKRLRYAQDTSAEVQNIYLKRNALKQRRRRK